MKAISKQNKEVTHLNFEMLTTPKRILWNRKRRNQYLTQLKF